MNIRLFALGMVAVVASVQPGASQDFPARAVRIVVPFAAGAGTDMLGRIVAQDLSKRLGQQFVVENRPGAAAQLGTELVAKAPADGYTLLWTVTDSLSVLPAIKPSLPYKVPDDFAFIASIAQQPFALAVNAKLPIHTLDELLAFARANPGKLNFGSAGVGSTPHMGIALMNSAARIDMVHVPYSGLAPATNALIAGTVDLGLVTPVFIKPHADKGTVRVLAITGTQRYPVVPQTPTLRELGLDVTTVVAYGLSAPAATPDKVLAALRTAMAAMVADPSMAGQLSTLGFVPEPLIGDAYRSFIIKDLAQWRAVAAAANIRIDN